MQYTHHNKDAPHQVIINLQCEIHEQLPNGQCCGRPSLKSSLFTIVGENYDDAIQKLEQFIERVKDAKDTQEGENKA